MINIIGKRRNVRKFKEIDDISIIESNRGEIIVPQYPYFRYGWTGVIRKGQENIGNSPRAIALAANKYEARKILLAAGISCPKISGRRDDVTIVRPLRTRGGRSFSWHMGYETKSGTWAQEFIDKEREYRAHCYDGALLYVQEKEGPREFKGPWNHSQGYTFRVLGRSEVSNALRKIAIEAVKALSLVYGAVDIIEEENKLYVLEVNTAPALEGYTLRGLVDVLLDQENKKHFIKNLYWRKRA